MMEITKRTRLGEIKISTKARLMRIELAGDVCYKDAKALSGAIAKGSSFGGVIECDFANLHSIDYSAAVLLNSFFTRKNVKILNQNTRVKAVFETLDDKNVDLYFKAPKEQLNLLERLGKRVVEGFGNVLSLSGFLGEAVVKTTQILINPAKMRLRELSNYIKDGGVNAVFIVSLTAFLIGVVLAYLGSSMLAKFGASIFIVEIMGMLTLREVAPLITAIVIAGRSASSFTAQIGAMKINEEIDAMKTMGFDPFIFLVLPRIIAMMLCLPLLIFIADAVSVFGQMVVCENLLDISFSSYLSRFREMVEMRHFAVGMIKAPFFGMVIAIIGCMRGFEVSGNAQSLGSLTTLSVVNAIFWVIALDALFAVIFMWVGL